MLFFTLLPFVYNEAPSKMNFQEFEYGDKKFMKFKNHIWMHLFHHDHGIAKTFKDRNEAMNTNAAGKYSILYLLNNKFRTKKRGVLKYEFIMNWPSLTYYYQWRQTKNPLEEIELIGVSKVTGFEPIHVTHTPEDFGGLANDKNASHTLLNGRIGHSDWYGTLGMLSTAEPYWIGVGIPAFSEPTNVVDLWIKTPYTTFTNNCNHHPKRFSIYQTFVFLVLL